MSVVLLVTKLRHDIVKMLYLLKSDCQLNNYSPMCYGIEHFIKRLEVKLAIQLFKRKLKCFVKQKIY